jgi:uncharacterized protein (DUF362 family)
MSNPGHSRREFMTRSAAALAAASILPETLLHDKVLTGSSAYKYPNPGKLVAVTNTNAVTGVNKVNEALVQDMFDRAITTLTGINSSPAAALASLFPGLTTASRIAIKPNLINSSVPTRKELLKAVITRLTQMLGGFPAANITIYERHSMSSGGYTTAYFGQQVKMVVDSSFPDLGYSIYCDGKNRPYSKTLHDADFLINMPVMKDHGCSMNLTMSFKNHMGTVNPGGSLGICSNKKAVLDIMADPIMVRKQVLVVLDGLFAVLNGGPGGAPQAMPATITVSQDPVTTDWYGRKTINQLRLGKGWKAVAGAYIEEASGAAYAIGVSNPSEMRITELNGATGVREPSEPLGWTLSDPYPNPFTDETSLHLELTRRENVLVEAFTTDGRSAGVLLDAVLDPGAHMIPFRPAGSAAAAYFITASIGGARVRRSAIRVHP